MDRNQEFKNMKEEYLKTEVPESSEGREKLADTVSRAKTDKRRKKRKARIRSAVIAAAAIAVVLLLPFTNRNVANAMENIPLIGPLFHVITADYYQYNDSHNQAKVKVPKIVESVPGTESQSETTPGTEASSTTETETATDNSQAIQSVNEDVKAYTDKLVDDFNKSMVKQGYSGLDISYQVVTDSDSWFTLEIMALQTMASGNEFDKYYSINKKTGEVVGFKDLFMDGVDYNTAITNEIRRQMKEQMDAGQSQYWLEDEPEYKVTGFHSLKEDTDYYFNKDGNLVIAFDEYEVGPGYIGAPQFVIPADVTKPLLKADIVP